MIDIFLLLFFCFITFVFVALIITSIKEDIETQRKLEEVFKDYEKLVKRAQKIEDEHLCFSNYINDNNSN